MSSRRLRASRASIESASSGTFIVRIAKSRNRIPIGVRVAKNEINFLDPSCFRLDDRAESSFVGVERLTMSSFRAREFPCENVGLGHRQSGAFTGEQGDASGRVADEQNSSTRPARHSDLADDVEVEVGGIIERGEDVWAFPAGVAELAAQARFGRRGVIRRRRRARTGI